MTTSYRLRADRANAWNPAAFDRARRDRGLSWTALSALLEPYRLVSTSAPSLYRFSLANGRRPPAALIEPLAAVLRVSPRKLTRRSA